MAEIRARSFRQVKLLVSRNEESQEAARLLVSSAVFLFRCNIEVINNPNEGTPGPELHDGLRIMYGLDAIKDWLEELKKEYNGR